MAGLKLPMRALALWIVISSAAGACSPRDPYATMCGVAMDTVSAITSVRLAMGPRETMEQYLALSEKQVSAARVALDGIQDPGIQGERIWRGLDLAVSNTSSAIQELRRQAPTTRVEPLLATAEGDLRMTMGVLPDGCLEP